MCTDITRGWYRRGLISPPHRPHLVSTLPSEDVRPTPSSSNAVYGVRKTTVTDFQGLEAIRLEYPARRLQCAQAIDGLAGAVRRICITP